MRITNLCLCFLFTFLASTAVATESVVVSAGSATLSPPTEDNGIRKVTINWTSNGSGAVTASLKNAYGTLRRAVFAPVASASPSANYDVTLKDEDDYDVFIGGGANQSATTPANVYLVNATSGYTGVDVAGHLALSVTNAGNAKRGTIKIYMAIKPE